ncbi:MAG: hypothetical protein QM736_06755 [Vicinamibacterales bacterium]
MYRRSVLPMALQMLGAEALHASAVATTRGIVCFSARSGIGKSTIAFGLRQRGFPQWADDGVVFRAGEGRVLATPLPYQARLRPTSQTLLGVTAETRSRFEENSAGDQVFTEPMSIGRSVSSNVRALYQVVVRPFNASSRPWPFPNC